MSNDDIRNKAKLNMKKFLSNHVKDTIVEQFNESKFSQIECWIDTGSYSLNKVISGSYFKGIPHGRITGFAGESGVGKSFVCANIIKNAQDQGYVCIIFDSESAIDNSFMTNIGVDIENLVRVSVSTVSEFQNLTFKFIKEIHDADPGQKILIVLDSLGNLSTDKEINDADSMKNAGDMGLRAKELKRAARILTNAIAFNNAAMVMTNHTYEQPAQNPMAAPTVVFAGGMGFKYCCSTIVFLKKYYERDTADKKVILGNRLVAKTDKNRFVPEGTSAEMYISRIHGLQKIYGIIEDACEAGLMKKNGSRIQVPHLDKSYYTKDLLKLSNYNEYWTPIINELDAWVQKKYSYSAVDINDINPDDEVEAIASDDIGCED